MTTPLKKRLRLIFDIGLCCSIFWAAANLIAACVAIYRSGDQPFSREAVAAAFSGISFSVYLCLGFVLAGFIMDALLPRLEKKASLKQTTAIWHRLSAKADLNRCDDDLKCSILTLRKNRRLNNAITAALLVIGSGIFLIYALDSSHFHQSEISSSMISAMYVLIPCMAVPFGYGIFAHYSNIASMEQEIPLLKQAPKLADPAEISEKKDRTTLVRNVLLLAGIVLLVYGFCTGGTADVLTKAVNICTECIGLG